MNESAVMIHRVSVKLDAPESLAEMGKRFPSAIVERARKFFAPGSDSREEEMHYEQALKCGCILREVQRCEGRCLECFTFTGVSEEQAQAVFQENLQGTDAVLAALAKVIGRPAQRAPAEVVERLAEQFLEMTRPAGS